MHERVVQWRTAHTELITRGELILAIGSADHIVAHCAQHGIVVDRVVDLPGTRVLPGLVDAHIHTAQFARSQRHVDLRGAPDLSAALERVRQHARTLPVGEPVRGSGWEWQKWHVPQLPTRAVLDAVVPDRPALLESQDLHSTWVNSALLQRFGLTDNALTPGVLREADGWLAKELLGPDDPDLTDTLGPALEALIAMGVTGVHDFDGPDARAAFERLYADDALPLRVVMSTRDTQIDEAIAAGRRTGAGNPWLREGHVKVFTDGALGSLTCHMCTPFRGTQSTGMSTMDDATLLDVVERCQAHGLGVAAHAIGDRANQQVLDVLAAARHNRPAGLRHRIEHAQHLRLADVPRFAELDVVASMQPTHALSDVPLVESLLGDRPLASYAWNSLWQAGAVVAFGSDAPVEQPNPFWALAAAIHRRPDDYPAEGWQPTQRLSWEQALWAHTVGPHRVAGQADVVGRLAAGQLADFVVVEDIPVTDVRHARVVLTVIGGRVRGTQHI